MSSIQQDFGVFRSLTQTPSWGSWKRICGLLDRYRREWDSPFFQEQVLPYLRWHLGRWPVSVLRYAQHSWVEGALRGSDTPQLQLANAMQFVSQCVSARTLSRLFDSPYLANMEVVNLSDLNLRRDDDLLLDVLGSPHLERVRGLDLSGSRLTGFGLDMLATASASRTLEWLDLSGSQLRSIQPLLTPGALEGLQDLRLMNNSVRSSGLFSGRYFPALTALDMRNNGYEKKHIQTFKDSPLGARLTDLKL